MAEEFIKVTWREILTGTISILIISAVSFVFQDFNSRLKYADSLSETNKDEIAEINSQITLGLTESIASLSEKLEDSSVDLTTLSNSHKSLEMLVTRLEVIVEGFDE